MSFKDELDMLLIRHLGPTSRPRDWLRTAAELYDAADRVDEQADERFTSAEMVADLDSEDHEPDGISLRPFAFREH